MKKYRLYGKMLLEVIGYSVFAGIIIYLVSGLSMADGRELLLEACGGFTVAGGMMIMVIVFYNLYQGFVPMALCLNAKRKEIFVWLQIKKVLDALGITLIAALLVYLGIRLGGDQEFHGGGYLAIMAFGTLYMMGSFGNLVGSLYYRLGKLAFVLLMVFSMICGGVIGFMSAMGIDEEVMEVFQKIMDSKNITWIVLGAAAAAGLLDAVLSWLSIRKMEIRC